MQRVFFHPSPTSAKFPRDQELLSHVQDNFQRKSREEIQIEFVQLHILAITQKQNIPRSEGGERVVEEVSVLTDGDLNNQYDKRAFPSYSRIDFADIVWEIDTYEMRYYRLNQVNSDQWRAAE